MAQELTVFNSDTQKGLPLIFDYNFNGKQHKAVNVKDLYSRLGLHPAHFAKWCKVNIEELFDNGDEWIFTSSVKNSPEARKRGRPAKDYIVTIDIGKELAMLARTEEGKMMRRMFIEAEKKLTSIIKQESKRIEIGEETSKFFNNLLESASIFSPTARLTLGAKISEQVYGVKIPSNLLPSVNRDMKSATEIGKVLGCSAIRVGKMANTLNLKRMPYATRRLSIAKDTHKEVEMWFYDEEAEKLISNYYYLNFKTNEANQNTLI